MENFVRIFFLVTICHAADINYMRNMIQEHFSNIRHHQTNPTYKELSRTFIYQEFRRFCLDTEFHNFTTTDNVTGSNIIGIMKGKRFGTFKDRIVGIGAHYDTVNNSAGVDDNGSGVAAMLEVAKRARTLDRHNTVIFVSFDLGEDNLKGSTSFVQEWLPQFLVTNYNASRNGYIYQLKLHGFYILDSIMEYNNSENSQKFPLTLTEDHIFESCDLIGEPQGQQNMTSYQCPPDLHVELWRYDLNQIDKPEYVRMGEVIANSLRRFNLGLYSLGNTVNTADHGALQLWLMMIEQYLPEVYRNLKADNFQGDYIHSVFRTDKEDSLGNALFRAWKSLSAPKYQMEIFPLPIDDVDVMIYIGLGDLLRSDHASFWRKYLPALFLTDSGNYRGNMMNCYHQPCDNLTVMLTDDNLGFLGKQADALYLSFHYLAETDCGIPPDIINTMYTITNDSLSAMYRCTEDTVVFPSGSNTTLTCMTSGEWSQISFVCVDRNLISGMDSLHAIKGRSCFLVLLMTMFLLMPV